jgi:hypothetical protein
VFPHATHFQTFEQPAPGAAGNRLKRPAEAPAMRSLHENLFPVGAMGSGPGR